MLEADSHRIDDAVPREGFVIEAATGVLAPQAGLQVRGARFAPTSPRAALRPRAAVLRVFCAGGAVAANVRANSASIPEHRRECSTRDLPNWQRHERDLVALQPDNELHWSRGPTHRQWCNEGIRWRRRRFSLGRSTGRIVKIRRVLPGGCARAPVRFSRLLEEPHGLQVGSDASAVQFLGRCDHTFMPEEGMAEGFFYGGRQSVASGGTVLKCMGCSRCMQAVLRVALKQLALLPSSSILLGRRGRKGEGNQYPYHTPCKGHE